MESSLCYPVVVHMRYDVLECSLFFFFFQAEDGIRDDLVEFRRVLFFFQAEDGIRDDLVTGVQTCALPIFQAYSLIDQTVRTVVSARDVQQFSWGTGKPTKLAIDSGYVFVQFDLTVIRVPKRDRKSVV